ncbi:uncharacterized protein LOC112199050 [Rosa chinensis]|uniref:uncharacterized protein LOC112199050 n=1 Tax=Rosa chinensis TaxID=74649 RepID=UPI000D0899D4|nr:uncharacterized protein LOC112199050 [Rosa chinensis]
MGKELAIWNEGLVDVFCDICIKEVDNNNRPHTHFNPEGWGKETGLGWDHKRQIIDASDEWWRLKIEKNKEYGKLKKKGIAPDFEDKLNKMFMGISATGQHAYSPSSALPIPRSPQQGDNEVNLEVSGDSEDNDDLASLCLKEKEMRELRKAIESRSTKTSMINKSVEEGGGTSIKDVMKDVTSLPGVEQGWEGSAHDTRVFLSVLRDPEMNFPKPPPGNIML